MIGRGTRGARTSLLPDAFWQHSQEQQNLATSRWSVGQKKCGVSKVKVKKTRKEKRAEKQRREQLQAEVNEARQLDVEEEVKDGYKHELDISSEELRVLQATDPTLGSVRIAVKFLPSKWFTIPEVDSACS